MTPTQPVAKELVLVGGGHAHVHVLKRFGMAPVSGVRVTLVTREIETPYSGMLPGFVDGTYTFEECHIDLHVLARRFGVRLVHDEAVGLDRAARRVILGDGPPLAYDVVSLDIGSTPRSDDVPGAREHAVPVKPISGFARRWLALLDRAARHEGPLRVAVVGGGAGGVELACAIERRLSAIAAASSGRFRPSVTVISRDALLSRHAAGAGRRARRIMEARGIAVIAPGQAVAVEPGAVALADGLRVPADEIVWVTQAGAAPWLAETGLDLDPGGFVRIGPTFASVTDPSVFAAGDIASWTESPRPKAGVFAVRSGPPLADNLRRALLGRPLQPFVPQSRYLVLIGTGDERAIATRGGLAAEGAWAWRLKEWIDRRWMRGYREFAPMAAPPVPRESVAADGEATARAAAEATMRCGGCGAKVGSAVLARVLARLHEDEGRTTARLAGRASAAPPGSTAPILIGLDAPDDAAAVAPPPGLALVQSVDFFRAFVDDPFVFGQIAANHALGDLYAMGAEPHSAQAIATVPYGSEKAVEEDLFRLMAGARRTLVDAGVALVGGHSAEGAELALGFAVNGFADPARLLRKGGLRIGDALVLTKPIGTGVLFAAAMRGLAKGRWVEDALAHMLRSNREAAAILRRHGVTACTDVTGFGLLGHLAEIVKASGVGAELQLGSVPALQGAAELFAGGQRSSLQEQNLRARHMVENLAEVAGDPRLDLLVDPQTAGGLLAGVAPDRAAACLAELRAAGFAQASIVGAGAAVADPASPDGSPLVRLVR